MRFRFSNTQEYRNKNSFFQFLVGVRVQWPCSLRAASWAPRRGARRSGSGPWWQRARGPMQTLSRSPPFAAQATGVRCVHGSTWETVPSVTRSKRSSCQLSDSRACAPRWCARAFSFYRLISSPGGSNSKRSLQPPKSSARAAGQRPFSSCMTKRGRSRTTSRL